MSVLSKVCSMMLETYKDEEDCGTHNPEKLRAQHLQSFSISLMISKINWQIKNLLDYNPKYTWIRRCERSFSLSV